MLHQTSTLLLRLLKTSLQVTSSKILWSLGLGVWFEYPYWVGPSSLAGSELSWSSDFERFGLQHFTTVCMNNHTVLKMHLPTWRCRLDFSLHLTSKSSNSLWLHHATPEPLPSFYINSGPFTMRSLWHSLSKNILKPARPISADLPENWSLEDKLIRVIDVYHSCMVFKDL
jgi:hypothetical protein